VLGNRVLRREEMAGGWRRLHNEELHNLCASPNIVREIKSRRMRWVGHVAHMGGVRKAYTILVGRREGRKPLERPGWEWEDNIKVDFKEIGCVGVDWIQLSIGTSSGLLCTR
jgi:hypothetical protein